MHAFALPFLYLRWHYTTALADAARLAANGLWFLYHFFSIPTLARTFFLPWRRLGDSGRPRTLNERFERLFMNGIVRLVGAAIRGTIIGGGVVAMLGAVLAEFFLILLWLAAPLILLLLVSVSLSKLFF